MYGYLSTHWPVSLNDPSRVTKTFRGTVLKPGWQIRWENMCEWEWVGLFIVSRIFVTIDNWE